MGASSVELAAYNNFNTRINTRQQQKHFDETHHLKKVAFYREIGKNSMPINGIFTKNVDVSLKIFTFPKINIKNITFVSNIKSEICLWKASFLLSAYLFSLNILASN